MRKNIAGQVVSFQMINTSDGSSVTTGTPTVYYTIDGGTQGTGAGTATHEGNGEWSYVPAQAETNGDHVAFTMVLANAITQTVNVYPVSFDYTDNYIGLEPYFIDVSGELRVNRESIVATGDARWTTAQGFSTHSAADVFNLSEPYLVDSSGYLRTIIPDIISTGDARWQTATGFSTLTSNDMLVVASGYGVAKLSDVVASGNDAWNTATGFSTHSANDVFNLMSAYLVDTSGELRVNRESIVATGDARWVTGGAGGISINDILTAMSGYDVATLTDVVATGDARWVTGAGGPGIDTDDILLAMSGYDVAKLEDIVSTGDARWQTATGFSVHSASDVFNLINPSLITLSGEVFGIVPTIVDSGDTRWQTATGFSTHSAADVFNLVSPYLTDTSGELRIVRESIVATGDARWQTATGFSTHSASDVFDLTKPAFEDVSGEVRNITPNVVATGDARWTTATGFSTHSPDDVVLKVLTSGNIDSFSVEETFRLVGAALCGQIDRIGGTGIYIRDMDDQKTRIIAEVNASGERTAITLDAT